MTREEAIKELSCIADEMPSMECANWIEAISMEVKALEQEPCADEYVKVPKKAMKYRTAGMVAYNAEWLKNHFDLERAVICGEEEPCDDCISRLSIINKLEILMDMYGNDFYWAVRKIIDAEPSIQPKHRMGRWIDADGDNARCGCCNRLNHLYGDYCKHCGAKMLEVDSDVTCEM